MIYALTGQLGTGKSLLSVRRLVQMAQQGRQVAANFPINLSALEPARGSKLAAAGLTVLPAYPTPSDLDSLGRGGPTEEKAGLLVLDECAKWMNARSWSDKERQALINWFVISRKRKWDVVLLVQSIHMLDKQIRELVELVGRIRRIDRIKVMGFAMPRAHLATFRYGLNPQDVVTERWLARGDEMFKVYATEDEFLEERPPYCILSENHLKWRYAPLPWSEALALWMREFWRGCVDGPPVRARTSVLAKRLAPLLQLPPNARWSLARSLVESGAL